MALLLMAKIRKTTGLIFAGFLFILGLIMYQKMYIAITSKLPFTGSLAIIINLIGLIAIAAGAYSIYEKITRKSK